MTCKGKSGVKGGRDRKGKERNREEMEERMIEMNKNEDLGYV